MGGLLILLAAMTTVGMAQHLGVLWVAIEITTLATAPLIYFNHNARSLEAAWKYLLVSSLGIALALLGTFLLALSGAGPDGPRSLLLEDLIRAGPQLSRPWVRAAFVFLLVGYGTKMGLAPLHSWKPDAYGEAPGLLGALLAGGITNFAFLSVVRVFQVTNAAGEGAFARDALLGLGLLSMALAAVFMAGQRDFKRMLAYSSVEHMGILAVALGLGGAAVTGAFYHVLNNGLAKGVLFLAAGNIHRAFGSKRTDEVRGASRRLPMSGPALPGRLPGGDRHPALQPVLERVHDPERRHRDRALRRGRPLPPLPGGDLHRDGGHRAPRGAGQRRGGAGRLRVPRRLAHRRAAARPAARGARARALAAPPAPLALLGRGAAGDGGLT